MIRKTEFDLYFFQSIFGSDVRDLRDKRNVIGWRPLDLIITLLPQKGSSRNREIYAKTNLRVICPSKYPKVCVLFVYDNAITVEVFKSRRS